MRVSTTDLQNAFGKYLSLVEKEDIIVVKNGKGVAKLVRYTDHDYYFVHEEAKNNTYTRKMSYEEYMELVNSSDQRYELIGGVIYLLASPSFRHQMAVNEIAGCFYNYFKGKPCQSLTSPFDVRLFGHATKFDENPNVVQPDVVVICDKEKVNAESRYEGVPTLVVEVLSPSTKSKDMAIKLNLYMESGIREFWLVDTENKSIMQYSFSEERDVEKVNTLREDETVKATAFKGLEILLKDIFCTPS